MITHDVVHARLEALTGLQTPALRSEWAKLYGTAAPHRMSRDLLLRMIAFRIQELAFGDLGKIAERRLRALADPAAPPTVSVLPLSDGSRLVREWKGQTHTVLVLEQGYEYRGQRHRSLSEIAHLITGAHWSGPRFFGLKSSLAGRSASENRHG